MKAVAILLLAALMAVTAATGTAATGKLRPGIAKLTRQQAHQLQHSGAWHPGCPVFPGHLRMLTTRYYGFDHRTHVGRLVVHETVAVPLAKVFRRLYRMQFAIRKISFVDSYDPNADRTADITVSFWCRNAVPSPCNGNAKTSWSMHAYGKAVDVNPRENPYVGCGMTRDKTARTYMNRSRVRPGMVTRAIYRTTFATIGWGWGGLWSGSTRDYMHFSINGR